MSSFTTVLEKYRQYAFSERDKGDRFERLMQAFLKTTPLYANSFDHVWLWKDFPYRESISAKDTGVDLVAHTRDGEYWAVQCKCYSEDTRIDKPEVDSFLATSSRQFAIEDGSYVAFSQRLWISTTNNWGREAENAIQNQVPEVSRLSPYDLENAPVDWEALDAGISGDPARTARKTPRPHQVSAIESVHEHFKAHDRGKLIMACGTGKTFTSLKIAEQEAGKGGLVLFLAPSIALVGQTLRAWTEESDVPIFPICICSDPKASQISEATSDEDMARIVDLAYPASTDPDTIRKRLKVGAELYPDHMRVVFSTYQSIDAIKDAVTKPAQNLNALTEEASDKDGAFDWIFDLIVCDEAHRTTGVTFKGKEESAFVRVHNNDFIRARKRLYMTATPRLYGEASKKKASDAGAMLCSMDDEALYGPEVYRIGFGEAVDKGLLADYKVLVLTVSDSEIPEALQAAIADKSTELNTDDASKLIGCINALSKRMLLDEGVLKATDPAPMRKAVAFCQTIKAAVKIKDIFNNFKDKFFQALPEAERNEVVNVAAKHVNGAMSAPDRDQNLKWLTEVSSEGNDCHILTNVRCLSEGVDVPSLDAVLFLAAKNSQIDVVQSVGRVMRTAPGKKFGYIIIPVLVPSHITPEEALDDNKRFAVVWTVLNALRAHDDRFEAVINKLDINKSSGGRIIVGPGGSNRTGGSDGHKPDINDSDHHEKMPPVRPIPLPYIQELQGAIYARMVQKVGNKRYWEQWAKDVADIAQRFIERIRRLVEVEGPHKQAFDTMLADLRRNINPSVDADELIEMLAQHMVTKPVFETLFENYSFVSHNPVSRALQSMVELLEGQALEKDAIVLSRFYESIRYRVAGIRSAGERQKVITELYDKFFRTAFPLTVERLGIVYTPVQIVDFINQSVADLLQATFGRSLSDENVHVLDPFTGTGTFIARMLESGLINKGAWERKYRYELHANEIVLLAYYIASINIENVYHSLRGEGAEYEPFPGICLTDTFQQGESIEEADWVRDEEIHKDLSRQNNNNSERVKAQRATPIQVIIGNPPYSVGQKSANDNAQNQIYPVLNARIAATYAAGSKATLKNSLYDSYIKAFRWASDRIDKSTGGIIAFVTNAGWLDKNAMDGMRKCLEEEFSAIYVFNLRGNCLTQGELRRKEAGNVFGSGSRTPIAVTVLLKNPRHEGKALINYFAVADYQTREQKLELVVKKHSVLNPGFGWQQLTPDEHGDWLNQRNDTFASLVPLGDKDDKKNRNTFFIPCYSSGVKTNRDAWCWNFSEVKLIANIKSSIDFYNSEVDRIAALNLNAKDTLITVLNTDSTKFSWDWQQRKDITLGKKYHFNKDSIRTGLYRPFQNGICYLNRDLNNRVYRLPALFPTKSLNNVVICVSGIGVTKDFTCIITNLLPDLELIGKSQCFPLYYYEEKQSRVPQLPGIVQEHTYERKDAITDFALEECRKRYGLNTSKEDIFYYVYGLLHSPEYRTTFANDLKKSLPRLPFVDTPAQFRAFSKAGRALADIHLNYEEQPPCPDVLVEGAETGNFTVQKMRFPDKADKSVIRYNDYITLSNIPLAAYDYVVNGRSAVEWIMERYQIKIDKASGIVNDPNDWATEHNKPRYILDLLLSVITVSLKTLEIVKGLPKLSFGDK